MLEVAAHCRDVSLAERQMVAPSLRNDRFPFAAHILPGERQVGRYFQTLSANSRSEAILG